MNNQDSRKPLPRWSVEDQAELSSPVRHSRTSEPTAISEHDGEWCQSVNSHTNYTAVILQTLKRDSSG